MRIILSTPTNRVWRAPEYAGFALRLLMLVLSDDQSNNGDFTSEITLEYRSQSCTATPPHIKREKLQTYQRYTALLTLHTLMQGRFFRTPIL